MKLLKSIFELLWYTKEFIRIHFFPTKQVISHYQTLDDWMLGPQKPPSIAVINEEHVMYLANIRGTNGYEIFQDAWYANHEYRLLKETMERYFTIYITNSEIPDWVEDYIRKVASTQEW